MKVLSICVIVLLFISGCHGSREQLFASFDRDVGKKAAILGDDIVEYYKSADLFKDVSSYEKDGLLYIEFGYYRRSCRVGKVFDADQILIRWYLISEPDRCVQYVNWMGPW